MTLRAVGFVLLLAASPLWAEKIDLDRTDPVPAGEPIPLQDFFRSPLLQEPQINDAGTHIAALISRNDKTELPIWDIANRRAEVAIQMVKAAKYNQYDNPAYVELKRRLGDPKGDRTMLNAMSPTNFVGGEGHGPRHLDNELAMWQRIEAFLSKNI